MSDSQLSQSTVVFGLRMWVLVGIGVGAAFVLLLALISVLCLLAFRRRRRQQPTNPVQQLPTTAPPKNPANGKAPKDIKEVPSHAAAAPAKTQLAQVLQLPTPQVSEQIAAGKEHRITYPEQQQHPSHRSDGPSPHGSDGSRGGRGGAADHAPPAVPEVSHLGWGHWYTLKELETATGMFSDENVIGEGGYGIVYHGVLENGTQVAVKNLLNNRGQAEKEFKVEVEAIGRVRHKNLVRLLGYCAEGNQRMLVYEYVDNGNLEQWLHGDVGPISPLTWENRMKIILGTAKGLMYLHEGLEPKVVHRDVKSSNILLDKHWNAKLSDFGLAKLLGSERSYVTTRVMGTFGYVAPEYAGTGMLNETSDIYSFGILIMEIISGRVPVDYNRPPGEVNLVDWLKIMVSNRNSDGVVDPKIPQKPTSRAVKKALLVALRCVDPDARKRPRIGHVIHMLEVDNFPYREITSLVRFLALTYVSIVAGFRIAEVAEHQGKQKHQRNRQVDQVEISMYDKPVTFKLTVGFIKIPWGVPVVKKWLMALAELVFQAKSANWMSM
ncbi:putative serine/threonine-protein kinase [Dichanthelium oligosanthes]|uniref:non-specific serine/threonine protein kinase n=1 Tax=Dichanthelium oligosanthes TaxID=888268 RepID=A0A1E5VW52_9POAL|nr:putative serine/threonine-protein kinase [Dichanthelium oligosanthes]